MSIRNDRQTVHLVGSKLALTVERCSLPEWDGIAWVLHPKENPAPAPSFFNHQAFQKLARENLAGTLAKEGPGGTHLELAGHIWEKSTGKLLPRRQPGSSDKFGTVANPEQFGTIDTSELFINNHPGQSDANSEWCGVWSDLVELMNIFQCHCHCH